MTDGCTEHKNMNIFELTPNSTGFLRIEWDKVADELMDKEEPRRKSEIWPEVKLETIKGVDKKGTPLGDCPYFSAGNTLIVSERLKKLIQAFTDDELEFSPVEIDGKSGYSWMNVLCKIDALDVEKSELTLFEPGGKIMYIHQARFRDEVINGHHIFTLANVDDVFVTEDLKNYLEDKGVKGVKYRDMGVMVENPFEEVFKPKKKKPKSAAKRTKRSLWN